MTIQQTFMMTGEEFSALSYLPDKLADEVRRYAALYGGAVNEIRLRCGGVMSITVMGENILCKSVVSEEDCKGTLLKLCRNSLYSEADSIKEGFITTREGIRAGICGKAICDNGVVTSLSDTTSICIRIPRRVPGAGDVTYELLSEMNFQKGIIVWSAPGIGKTTLLRELSVRLGGGSRPVRVSVIDTRHELGAGIARYGLLDILDGYPRAKGIEIAKRTMSPQVIICDEIATDEDSAAILDALGSGVCVVASVHAGSREELLSKEHMRHIIKSGCIGAYVGLLGRTYGGFEYDIFKCCDNLELRFRR